MGEGAQPGLFEILDLAGIERDALEAKVRQLFDALGQFEQRPSGGYADAAEADISFRQDSNLDLRGGRGIGKLARGEQAIERHGDARLSGEGGEPLQFRAADDRDRPRGDREARPPSLLRLPRSWRR